MIYFKYNEVGHFVAKCLNKRKFDRNDKNDKKYFNYMKKMVYKEKRKKSCYIVEEEHTKSSSNDDKEVVAQACTSVADIIKDYGYTAIEPCKHGCICFFCEN